VRQVERVADGHDPVTSLHLRRVAELDGRQRVIRLLGQLNQGAVGQRIAADDLGIVFLVVVFTVERDLDLRRALDDVVVRQDET
jgi:hypothetical protein